MVQEQHWQPAQHQLEGGEGSNLQGLQLTACLLASQTSAITTHPSNVMDEGQTLLEPWEF